MQRVMLKSKIHGVTVTDTQLYYAGSITLDENLLLAADLLPNEQVQILNLNTGDRLMTYTIVAPAGSGTVMLNGPAARKGETGDTVLVLSYASYDDVAAQTLTPVVVHVDENNQPKTNR